MYYYKICCSLWMLCAENKEMSKGNPVSGLTLTNEYHSFFLTFTFPQVCTLYFSNVFKLHICHPSYSCSRTLRYYNRTLFLL